MIEKKEYSEDANLYNSSNGQRERCRKLKEHLTRRNIDYEERVSGNTVIIEVRKRSGSSSPEHLSGVRMV